MPLLCSTKVIPIRTNIYYPAEWLTRSPFNFHGVMLWAIIFVAHCPSKLRLDFWEDATMQRVALWRLERLLVNSTVEW